MCQTIDNVCSFHCRIVHSNRFTFNLNICLIALVSNISTPVFPKKKFHPFSWNTHTYMYSVRSLICSSPLKYLYHLDGNFGVFSRFSFFYTYKSPFCRNWKWIRMIGKSANKIYFVCLAMVEITYVYAPLTDNIGWPMAKGLMWMRFRLIDYIFHSLCRIHCTLYRYIVHSILHTVKNPIQ